MCAKQYSHAKLLFGLPWIHISLTYLYSVLTVRVIVKVRAATVEVYSQLMLMTACMSKTCQEGAETFGVSYYTCAFVDNRLCEFTRCVTLDRYNNS